MRQTILEIFEETARAQAGRPAMARKQGGVRQRTSWAEFRDAVRHAARGLLATGIEPGHGAAILSFNRPEWFVANLAAMSVGARPVGIYTNSTPEQCRYVTEHAAATVAFVENREALVRLEGAGRPNGLKAIVQLDGEPAGEGVISWGELL
jgi:long-subunit acyl-CoA synthetase (AMP-forming)